MGTEGVGDAGRQGRRGGGVGDVPGDVVAAAEQQRHQYGGAGAGRGQLVEGVGEQRGVQLDVPQVHGQTGPQRADPLQQPQRGGQGARVAAAVGRHDEGGGGAAGRDRAPGCIGYAVMQRA